MRTPVKIPTGGPLAASKAAVPTTVDVVLTTKRAFPVTDAFPRLKVGTAVVQSATRRSPDGKTLTVTLPQAAYNQLPGGTPVSLKVLASQPDWQFGALPK